MATGDGFVGGAFMRPVQGSHIFTGMRPMRSRQVAIPPTLDMRNRVVIWRTRRGVALLAMPQRKATRLGEHDYSRQGYYFVTVCARSRRSAFGEIEGGKMCLNALGALTEERWREIPGHFPDAGLDEFIVMPNHIHGIVIIGEANCSGRGAYMRPYNRRGETRIARKCVCPGSCRDSRPPSPERPESAGTTALSAGNDRFTTTSYGATRN